MDPDISEKDKEWILRLIRTHLSSCRIYAFGSRIHGTAKKYSDLDLALDCEKEIPLLTMNVLRQTFSESNLLFKVDLLDFQKLDETFQNLILKTSQTC